MDFTNVKFPTPKDCFPLPNIDQLVNATIGFKVMSFMDAYLGYHQIRMHQMNEEKRHLSWRKKLFVTQGCLLG